MKNNMLLVTLVFTAFVTSTTLSQTPDPKAEASNSSSFVAPQLRKETKDSVAAYELFRTESHLRMTNYEKIIDAFSATLSLEKTKTQNKNYPKVVALEKKDAKLRTKIESYKPRDGSDWLTFKRETTLAIDNFGNEVADLKIEN